MNHHPADEPLRHGSYRDLTRCARIAVACDRWYADDAAERYRAAPGGIVEHVLTAEERPSHVDIGTSASDDHVREEMRHHGWAKRRVAAGSGAALVQAAPAGGLSGAYGLRYKPSGAII